MSDQNKMTDEQTARVLALRGAIEHAHQIADSYKDTAPDCACAKDHRQLAEWLEELVEKREAARHYRERAEVAESRLASLETAWALHGTSIDAVLEVETARQEAAALTARLERYETMYTVPAIPIDPEAEARVDEYLRGLRRQPEPGSRAWSTSSAVHGLPETSASQRLPSGGGRDGGES